MPRPERPLAGLGGSVEQLAAGLRELRERAGGPGYRAMAARVNYSVATLSAAASGRRLPTLEVTLAYAAACGGDLGEWERRWREAERLSVAPADDSGTGSGDGRSPYPGLAMFQPQDAELFFGRAVLVDELVRRLGQRRFLAVFGPSGAGKSSVVRAGLIPAVGGPVVVLTPGAHPMAELAVHLARHAGVPAGGLLAELRDDPARAHLMVRQGLHDVSPDVDLLVVVDQFEEAFASCGDPAERADFVAALLAMCREPDGRARVVLAVRADHYARFTEHPELLAALTDAQVLIGGMSPAELREAFTKPAEQHSARVEGALVATIVAEVSNSPGALPLAAHALREAWHRRQGAMVTLAGYQAAGGVAGAVAHTAEQAFERLSEQECDVAQRVLLRMVDVGLEGLLTRRRLSRAELDTIERAPAVIEAFAAARLVSTDRDTVEITHEALIRGWPRLRGWIEDNRAGLRLHRQLTEAAAAWESLCRDDGALYRGLRLSTALEAADVKVIDLTGAEQEFLQVSRALRDREARLRHMRRLFTGLVAVLSVMLVVASVAVWQWRTAVTAQQTALSRQLAAQSAAQLTSNPDLAALLAVHAYRISPTREIPASLYAAAIRPAVRSLTGHTAPVSAVAYSPDGRRLVTAGADKTVRLWDLDTGRSSSLPGHTGSVFAVAYSSDGRHLAAAGADKTVRLWDLDTGRSRSLTGHTRPVLAVAYSPDGRHLAAAGEDKTVRLWDLDTGRSRSLTGHTAPVFAVAYSPDGRHLATAGEDKTVRVWDLDTGQSRSLTGHTAPVFAVAYSPDGRHLATAGEDKTVRVWDLDTGQSRSLTGHTRLVIEVAYSPDGRHLVTAGADGTVRVWDLDTGRSRALTGHTGPVLAVAYSPDGRHLATVGADGTVRVWDLDSLQPGSLTGHTGPVSAVAYSSDGRHLATAGLEGTVRLWDLDTGQSRFLPGHTRLVIEVAYSPDGRHLATAGEDKTVRVWDLDTGRSRALTGHTRQVVEVAYSPDGRHLATAGIDRTVRLWDLDTGQSRSLTGHTRPVIEVAYSPDGRHLATAGEDKTVRLWDLDTGQSRSLTGHTGPVLAVAYSPDGRHLAAAGEDKTVRLWDLDTGQSRALTGHTGPVLAVAYSPDGRHLATAGEDETVRVWDVGSERSRALSGHTGPVSAVAYSPDGHHLASAGEDRTVRVWADTAPTPAVAIDRICTNVERELTPEEREAYLPSTGTGTRACPRKTG